MFSWLTVALGGAGVVLDVVLDVVWDVTAAMVVAMVVALVPGLRSAANLYPLVVDL